VFSLMVLSWLTAWSFRHPIILVTELHTPEHPFVQNFDTEAGVAFGRLVRDRIHWLSSKESWGLQVADIAANVVGRAIEELNDTNGTVTLYGSLMRSSYYGPLRGPGLVSPLAEPDNATAMKYRLLVDEMQRRPRNEHRPRHGRRHLRAR